MPCAGVDHQHHALTGGQAAADLVPEVDVAGRVDEVEGVALPVDAHVLRLDRDAALALEVHRVEVLAAHVARIDGAGDLEDAVGERALAVVDVGDDREVADACGDTRSGGDDVPPSNHYTR
jgi:predicted Mrr-cat superfamily restriction endonuclease